MRHFVFLSLTVLILGSTAACGSSSEAQTFVGEDAGEDAAVMSDAGAEAAVDAPADDAETQPDASTSDAALEASQDQDSGICPPLDDPQWTIETVDADPGFKARVAVALDPEQRVRLAYNRATSADGWENFELRVAEQTDEGWKIETVVASDGFSNEYPTIVVDNQGVSHVVFNRYVPSENQIDLFVVSGTIGAGFSTPVNLTQTQGTDEFGGSVAMGPDGVLHVIHIQRTPIPDEPGKYTYDTGYVAYDGAPKDAEVIGAGTLMFTGSPEQSIAVDPAGRVHVAYLRPGEKPSHGVAHYRKLEPIGWSTETMVTSNQANATGISIAAAADRVHFTYGKGTVDVTMMHRVLDAAGLGSETALTNSVKDRAYYLGLQAVGTDGFYVAFRRLIDGNADVFFISTEPGTLVLEESVTQTSDEDELVASLAAGRCGEAYVAFLENFSTAPDGRVMLATRR
jgi:hypothetical protein